MAFTTTYSATHTTTNAGWSGYTLRNLIPASAISLSGGQIRVSFGSAVVANFNKVYIGHASSTGSLDFDGTQVQLKVGGSGAFSIGTGTVVTDAVTYALDETRDLVVAFYFGSGSGICFPSATTTGAASAYIFADDAASTTRTGSYTTYNNFTYLITRIEEDAAPAGGTTYSLTGVSGVYTISGKAGALGFNRKVLGVSGVYVLSGKAGTLTYNSTGITYQVSGVSGVYVLSGKAGALSFNRKLIGVSGVYTMSGKANSYTFNRVATYTLLGVSGAYTLSGKAGAYTFNRKVLGVSGAYTLVGRAGGLTYGKFRRKNPGILLTGG